MVNVILAFGITDNSYFIAAGDRTYRNDLPTRMETAVTATLSTPFHFASIGHAGRFYVWGHPSSEFEGGSTMVNNILKIRSTSGITFGDGGAWAWFYKATNAWQTGGVDTDTNGWLNKLKGSMGMNFRPILGARGATVLLYSNGEVPYMKCATPVANVLSAVKDKGLIIRYLALSPKNPDWFFIQFEDNSLTWHITDDHPIAGVLKGIATSDNLKIRNRSTLAFV